MYATYTGDKFPHSKGHEYYVGQDVLNSYFMEQLEFIRHGDEDHMLSLNEYVTELIDRMRVEGVPISKNDRRLMLHFIDL